MIYPLLADLVLVVHLAFVVFVLCGGLLVLKWRWMTCVHLPAAAWGAVVEFTGWICPLTPLENWLRVQGGGTGYEDDVMTHYLLPILYPVDLTRDMQLLMGSVVVILNAAIYGWLWRGTQGKTELTNRHQN
jgi:hypothetical protein